MLLGVGVFVTRNLGLLSAPRPSEARLVRADPKTLVAQANDFESGIPVDPVSGSPITGEFPRGSGKTPIDAYVSYIGGQGLNSGVALYGSVVDASDAFRSIKVPAQHRALDFSLYGGLKVGDEQKAFSWYPSSNFVEADLYWRSSNVIAWLSMTQPISKNYPTLPAVEDNLDNFAAFTYASIAPRVQTRIRLASGS